MPLKIIGKIPNELLPEEKICETLSDIKSILEEKSKVSAQDKLLLIVSKQFTDLSETIKDNRVLEWQHIPVYDGQGKIERITSYPVRTKLKTPK